jgi:pimeloyl-ACP methyl ester carboxylesterase
VAVYLLFATSAINGPRKELLNRILSWRGDALDEASELARAMDTGIGNPGQYFNNGRPVLIMYLVAQIRRSAEWLRLLAERVPGDLGDRPMLLFWGHRDRAFGGRRAVRGRWMREFPRAEVVNLPRASRYIQEDAPTELAGHIQRCFGAHI